MKVAVPARIDVPASTVTVVVGHDNVIRVPRPATSVRTTVVVDLDEARRRLVELPHLLDQSPGD